MATPPQRLDRRVLAALCLAATAGAVNNSALGPFIPDIARDFNSSVPVIGQAATASWVMSALGGTLAGPLADHYGHRRLLLVGLGFTVLSALGGAAATGYWWLILARVIGGVGFSATVGVAFAMATLRYRGEVRLRALSILSSALSFSAILGIPMLTLIANPFTWRGSWVFIALLASMAALLLFVNVPVMPTGSAGRFRARQIPGTYGPLLRSRTMLFLFTGTTFQGMLLIAALTYNGSYFIEELGLSVQEFGLLAAFMGVAFLLGSLASGRLGSVDLKVAFAWTTLMTGGLMLMAFSTGSGVIVTTVLLSLAFFLAGIQVVTILALVADATPSGQGTTLVFNESLFALGAAAGAGLGGILIDAGGFQAFGLGLPFFALVAASAVWRTRITDQPEVQHDPSLPVAAPEDTHQVR